MRGMIKWLTVAALMGGCNTDMIDEDVNNTIPTGPLPAESESASGAPSSPMGGAMGTPSMYGPDYPKPKDSAAKPEATGTATEPAKPGETVEPEEKKEGEPSPAPGGDRR